MLKYRIVNGIIIAYAIGITAVCGWAHYKYEQGKKVRRQQAIELIHAAVVADDIDRIMNNILEDLETITKGE